MDGWDFIAVLWEVEMGDDLLEALSVEGGNGGRSPGGFVSGVIMLDKWQSVEGLERGRRKEVCLI